MCSFALLYQKLKKKRATIFERTISKDGAIITDVGYFSSPSELQGSNTLSTVRRVSKLFCKSYMYRRKALMNAVESTVRMAWQHVGTKKF